MADRELHGYGHLLDSYVPAATGLNARGRGVRPAHTRGAPVLRIYGGRGTGKTAVCRRLHDTHVNRAHVALWPMTDRTAPPAGPGDEAGLLASRPLAALAWLVHELDADVPVFGRIPFPRFTYGLVAATVWQDAAPDAGGPTVAELADFRARRTALLAALADGPGRAPVVQRFGAFAEALLPLVSWLAPALAPLEDLLRQFVRQASGGTRPHAAALRWWDGQDLRVAGTGIERVLRYAQTLHHQVPAAARGKLEERLAAAFLADIDAYHRRPHLLSRPLPLIVLDDTHTGTGERLFDLLVTAYATAAGPDNARGGEVRRPVLVTTVLGAAPPPGAARERTPVEMSRIGALDWRSPDSEAPEEWQVWVRAPALRADGIAPALGADCPRGLPNLIEQISAGRAGLARPLVEAAGRDLLAGEHSLLRRNPPAALGRTLLALPPADPAARDRTVADVLLRYLVPDPELIGPLLRRAVPVSADDVPHAPGADAEADRVSAFLRAGHWERSPWASRAGEPGPVPPVADRALRELLLHRLRAECSPASGAPDAHLTWTRLHSAALDDERVPAAVRLHHALALGRRERAVSGLHALLRVLDRPAWLAAVQTVCAAPHPPDGYPVRRPEPPEPCRTCLDLPSEGGGAHRDIARLVTLLWDQSTLCALYPDDPDSPDNRLRLLLTGSHLADDEGVTAEAARRWPALLARGHRVPELPVPPTGRGN
ncbi:hypothetical protein [Streptomyces sp. NPDC000134]|uniref:hypothetical protein n=1 Tax=Streptomyces sp. NPDC000134 TaxID=3364536 RepID=UPI0036C5ADBF